MAEPTPITRRQNQAPESVTAPQHKQYLTFTLGSEVFAMEIRYVREVIQYGGLTRVPLMPVFIRGVINLRGAVVPIIDLSARFHRLSSEVTKRTCIVILEVGHEDDLVALGVLVDNVREVLDIQDCDIEAAPSFGNSLRSDFIQGVGKISGRFVILLEVNQVVSIEELATLAANRTRESEGAYTAK